ncbi:conserved hypothetical protein [Candidatus Sulfopaludibacter sp. SbA4]|nr:conserved hypothetical protein [Candidatus Sulfopaludibacter sp. SbA4]
MTGLRTVVTRIVQCGITEGEIWINGSFLTEKIDPKDVDLILMYAARFYDSGTEAQTALIDWLNSKQNEPKALFHCDTNGICLP